MKHILITISLFRHFLLIQALVAFLAIWVTSCGDQEEDSETTGSTIDNPITTYSLCTNSDATCNKNWEPSLKTSCVATENISPSITGYTNYLKNNHVKDGTRIFEPAILFIDETLTIMVKDSSGLKSKSISKLTNISSGFLEVYPDSSNPELYDDGTNGDLEANDGIFTRSCLSLSSSSWNQSKNTDQAFDIFFINKSYRNTEKVFELYPGLSINDTGFFISLGDEYTNNIKFNSGQLTGPSTSRAMAAVWAARGDIFDIFVFTPRHAGGGAGMWRLHDFIQGLNHNPSCSDYSYCYNYIDSQEHPELIAGTWIGWPSIQSLTHELEHAMFGINTKDFPESGNRGIFLLTREWTVDGMHIEADSTVNTYLKGPLWDPARGYPYAVKLKVGNRKVETHIVKNQDGTFRLKERSTDDYKLSDIFLYILGVITAEEANETYYKLINYSLNDCISENNYLLCTNDLINYDEVITFTTADFIKKFGGYSNPRSSSFDPANFKLGILNISDRKHTEAEITLKSIVYRSYATGTGPKVKFGDQVLDDSGNIWSYITHFKSKVIVDFREIKGLRLSPKTIGM